ncbi:hypothetical protein [Miniphocaeibacter halophilus]|uniref:Uncharacterized protein n=1 Tax=Miniphocaeibacter halophilus TaxID=2931922 RepID=A0AC61MPT4_9FIRM|nr:hypothetical protein [Miniphocaeibacter halophilus]QQK07457.1 hypothetical protein JFY71_09080 [Miniphocaeibacter halophilus]
MLKLKIKCYIRKAQANDKNITKRDEMKMKKIISMLLLTTMILSSITPVIASASNDVNNSNEISISSTQEEQIDEKLVDEVAEKLEFLYEKAAIFDKDGAIVDFNMDLIKEHYGNTDEVKELEYYINKAKEEYTLKSMYRAGDWNCMKKELGLTSANKAAAKTIQALIVKKLGKRLLLRYY